MEHFEIGTRYESYDELMKHLNQFCIETQSQFWKRDGRTIQACRNLTKPVKAALVYYEVKFICILGGEQRKSRAVVRHRAQRIKTGCPAYLRFKVSEDGYYLVLVAMNLRHNHQLSSTAISRRKVLHLDTKSGNKTVAMDTTATDDSDEAEYIEVHVDEDDNHKVNFSFKGLIAPVLTAFKNNEAKSLNTAVIPAYAKFLNASGIQGILVNGTSGEGMSMNVKERKLVTEAWVKAVETTNQHLMVQVGGAPLPDVIELAKHAESVGVNSLLCLPELYFKPTTPEELIDYLSIVGAAAPNTPLLYYHIPSFTNVTIDMGVFLNKVVGKIPNFVGIKFTSKNMEEGGRALKANGGKFAVFLGCDQVMAGAYVLGFDSAIATSLNMFPQLGIDILESIKKGDIQQAREKQDKLNGVIEIVTRNGTWVPTMKEAMTLLTPIECGPPREPLVRLNQTQITQIATELKQKNYV